MRWTCGPGGDDALASMSATAPCGPIVVPSSVNAGADGVVRGFEAGCATSPARAGAVRAREKMLAVTIGAYVAAGASPVDPRCWTVGGATTDPAGVAGIGDGAN